ncbi:hypothetical protein PR048_005555 [Dryococelus australis]|uniref:DDE Tnp4 domain-containing protein n=1 Tax=Dryococelus australis TaxID=614101 RepID=A0ABQ9I9K8_9NEOP|nr:hypothetical protein PR048_005555 [Dryococelus australis]
MWTSVFMARVETQPLPDSEEDLPFVFVSDEVFALHINLLRPYGSRELDHVKRVFNCRLTRTRHFVENKFGIMKN